MNNVSGMRQNPAFQGKYLLRLRGKKGQTFLTTVKTDKIDENIVEIKGKGIYKGKKTGENFQYANKNGFDFDELFLIASEIQSKIDDKIDVLGAMFDITYAKGRETLGALVQVLKP